MSSLYSNTDESDESLSSKSLQSFSDTSEKDPSSDFSDTGKPEEFGTILNLSRAVWNLPTDDSTETENEQDGETNVDETLSSNNDRVMDEMTYYNRTLIRLHGESIRRRLGEYRTGSRTQTESIISKQPYIEYGSTLLILILVTLIPASAIACGAQYIGHCPANWVLPHLVLLIGVLGTIIMVYVIVSLCRESSTFGGRDLEGVVNILVWLFGILMLVEITLFWDMSASNDTSSKNYCSGSFYFYTSFINILTILVALGRLVKFISSVAFVNPSFNFLDDDLGFY